MKEVVKLVLTMVVVGLFAFNTLAQDEANKAIELYNQTVQAAQSEDYATAIEKAKEGYAIAKTVEDAAEIKTQLDNLIPKLYFGKAQKDLKEDKFDEALASYEQAGIEAKNFNDAETLGKIPDAITKVYLAKADKQYSNNDFEGAIANFDKVLETDPKNAQVLLHKSNSILKKGDINGAIKSFEATKVVAKETEKNEIENSANEILAKIYKDLAGDAQKNKKWADVVSNAEKALTYKPDDANAVKLADIGNLQQGLALQQTNKTKACQYLKKVKGNDPKIKDKTTEALKALGCN